MSLYNTLSKILSLLEKMSAGDLKFMQDISIFLSDMFKRSACICKKKAFLNMLILSINLKVVESALQFV